MTARVRKQNAAPEIELHPLEIELIDALARARARELFRQAIEERQQSHASQP